MSNPTPLSRTKTRFSPSTISLPIAIVGACFVLLNFHALLIRLVNRMRTSFGSPESTIPGAISTTALLPGSAARISLTIWSASALMSSDSRLISPLVRRNSICRPSKTEVIRSLASRIRSR